MGGCGPCRLALGPLRAVCVSVHKTGDQNHAHTSDVLGSAAQSETRYDFARSLKIILVLIEAKVMLDWITLEFWTFATQDVFQTNCYQATSPPCAIPPSQ